MSARKAVTLFRIILILLALPAGNFRISASDSLRCKLFPGGRAIGQPLARTHADVRMVRVESFAEAYRLFRSFCSPWQVSTFQHKGYSYECCRLPGSYGGYLLFTRRVRPGRHEVGIIYVRSPVLNRLGITEIHFVETIKIK